MGGDAIIARRIAEDLPILGICVGHQVLFAHGDEHGDVVDGVGVYPGLVTQLKAVRLPHMGWNEVRTPEPTTMFAGVTGERFYFVHSYGALTASDLPDGAGITWARHEDDDFVAAVEWGRVWSTQFHPEKSGRGRRTPAAQLDRDPLTRAGFPRPIGRLRAPTAPYGQAIGAGVARHAGGVVTGAPIACLSESLRRGRAAGPRTGVARTDRWPRTDRQLVLVWRDTPGELSLAHHLPV